MKWNGYLPEAALFVGTLAILFVNPTPFPYNLLLCVPFAFLFAFRYVSGLWDEVVNRPEMLNLTVCLLLVPHLVIFSLVTRRHLEWTNYRQNALMVLTEDLTDPSKDRVFDGVGLVPTRFAIATASFLHSLNIQNFELPGALQIRDMLAANPAAVIIPNYRTDWLPEADHEYIRAHYVPLGDDFWVLGTKLPRGGGSFEIIHPGRYQISQLKQSNILGTYPETLAEQMKAVASKQEEVPFVGTLDGGAVSNRPVELTVGTHRVASAMDDELAVVWVGPKLDKVPQVGRGDHRRLFVNWY